MAVLSYKIDVPAARASFQSFMAGRSIAALFPVIGEEFDMVVVYHGHPEGRQGESYKEVVSLLRSLSLQGKRYKLMCCFPAAQQGWMRKLHLFPNATGVTHGRIWAYQEIAVFYSSQEEAVAAKFPSILRTEAEIQPMLEARGGW